jgi:hypothetical protein
VVITEEIATIIQQTRCSEYGMENLNNNKYKFLSIALVVAIVGIIIFVIIPNFSPVTPDKIFEKIDFSNSAWIEQYMEKSVGLYENDFYHNSAFSYNIRSNKMIVTYVTQKSVEEVRDHYLSLPGAELTGRNDETSLNVTAEVNGEALRIYNYYSSVSRVIELELTLDASLAEQVISQLETAFQAEEIVKISEIDDLASGEIFGGYVRYRYDDFDDFSHPYIPIFSRAYLYDGSEEDFNRTIDILNETYSSYQYDETQNTNYYRINGQIVSISFFVTDSNEKVVSISLQKETDED